ncbi:tyrosine-type recombinase/integrase [Leucobacter sp. Z1108]|uniref:tyrosine-type recombinase/integrase n=1 Tax=Leucobacter sp. Z1108 TaxID=3439066 RepID=UPI003F416CFB
MAFTEKRGNVYRGGYRDSAGVKRYAPGTFPKMKAAKDAASRLELASRRSKTDAAMHGKTWGEWCAEWWPKRPVERSTLKSEHSMVKKHIMPKWAGVRVTGISRPDVQEWANELADQLTPGTARRIMNVFVSSLSAAIDANIIDANPATRIKLPPTPQGREVYLTREQFAAVDNGIASARDSAVAEFLVGTGLRWGELAGLHWHNLDLDTRMVTVADTFDRQVIKPYPKGRKIRRVPFFEWAVENLETPEAFHPCPVPHTDGPCRSGLVFHTRTGGPLSDRNYYRRVLAPALAKAGLESLGATLHDLRHTYASWLVQSGIPLERIAELLGHSSVATTRIYAHLAPTQHDDLARAIGAAPELKRTLRAVS